MLITELTNLHLQAEATLPDGTTTGEMAERLYGSLKYDHALPQTWVDAMYQRGIEARGRFVWHYPKGSLHGMPLPLTLEAAMDLAFVAGFAT